jgi:hypothetical protein
LKYSNPQESKGDDKDNQVASEKLWIAIVEQQGTVWSLLKVGLRRLKDRPISKHGDRFVQRITSRVRPKHCTSLNKKVWWLTTCDRTKRRFVSDSWPVHATARRLRYIGEKHMLWASSCRRFESQQSGYSWKSNSISTTWTKKSNLAKASQAKATATSRYRIQYFRNRRDQKSIVS